MANGFDFPNLAPYQQAVATQMVDRSRINPIEEMIKNYQQGVALQQQPQLQRDAALQRQLAAAVQQAQLEKLQRPQIFEVGGSLITEDPTSPTGVRTLFTAPANPVAREKDPWSDPIQTDQGLVQRNVFTGETRPFTLSGAPLQGGTPPKADPNSPWGDPIQTDQGLIQRNKITGENRPAVMDGMPLTRTPGGKSGTGKPLPKTVSERFSDAAAAVDNLIKLKSYVESPDIQKISGPIYGRTFGNNPFNELVGNFDGIRGTSKQVIGKYLEGGVLREADEKKYEKIVPSLVMLPATQKNQTLELYDSLKKKINRDIATYEKSGYDVSDLKDYLSSLDSEFSSAQPRSSAQPITSPVATPGSIVKQGGKRYRFDGQNYIEIQ